MVRLLLRLLMQRRHHAAYAAGYERGMQEGKHLAHARLFDLSRNEYPGAARTIQHFLRRSHI